MPGPMSAPNGNARLVQDAKERKRLQRKNQLVTGKTSKKKP